MPNDPHSLSSLFPSPPSGVRPLAIGQDNTDQALRMKFAAWTEDFEDPDPIAPFPLRKLAPDAAAFLARAGFFTSRDMRFLDEFMQLGADLRDHEKFYDLFLQRVEGCPWIIPLLEIQVARERGGPAVNKLATDTARNKFWRIVSKLPISKLGLSHNEALQDRLSEFFGDGPVATELWVAAFCEYALTHYRHHIETYDQGQIDLMFGLVTGNLEIEDFQQNAIEEGILTGEWEHAVTIIRSRIIGFQKAGAMVPEELRSSCIDILAYLADSFDLDSDPESFRLLAELAETAATLAEDALPSGLLDLMETLDELGFDHEDVPATETQADLLRRPAVRNLIDRLRDAVEDVAGLDVRSGELDHAIAEASGARDFARLKALADEASAIDDRLAAERELRAELTQVLGMVMQEDEPALAAHFDKTWTGTPDEPEEADAADDPAPPPPLPAADSEDDDPICPEPVPAGSAAETAAETMTEGAAQQEGAEPDDEPARATSLPSGTDGATGVEIVADAVAAADEAGVIAPETPAVAEIATPDRSDLPEAGPAARVEPVESAPAASGGEVSSPASLPVLEDSMAPTASDDSPRLDAALLPALIARDLIGLAADAAAAMEAHDDSWPIEAAALRAAAASRARHGDYGADTQRVLTLANRAQSVIRSDLGANILFGALLRPAILQQSFSLRSSLPDLARGALGPLLKEVGAAMADLEFDFPPGPDVLARLSGTRMVPQKDRIIEQLAAWSDATSQKTSRWSFATSFMHHVISPAGPIGKARAAIQAGRSDAVRLANQAVENLGSGAEIEDRALEYASESNRPLARLHPRGVDYLQRQFDEALALLSAWVAASQRDGTQSQRSEERLRTIVGNLLSRLGKAASQLRDRSCDDLLESAVATWLADRIDETICAVKGSDTGSFATVEEALTAERDLLASPARRHTEDSRTLLVALADAFAENGIPEPRAAYDRAREQGAFETAGRLAERFGFDAETELEGDIDRFAQTWLAAIGSRERRLKSLVKVDYDHQEEINRHLNWCETALERIEAVAGRSSSDDLDDIPDYARDLDRISDEIETHIRKNQEDRIALYRSDLNAEDADALLAACAGLTLDAVEDRIAQLRDGRSAATFEAVLEGMISEFTPDFITAASQPDWPGTKSAYEAALSGDGLLATDEDRRGAALDFLGLYLDLCIALRKGKPSTDKIRALFEEIGFEDARISDIRALGRTRSWQMTLNGTLRSDGWFLPPVFGSRARNGYSLLLIGPDTLPEAIHKVLDPEVPTILLLSGVADLARRREFAERLRGAAIPALLLDEALIAFAATRRDTRARTIFECGLPYGRVEPYTTDAGQVPTEMFFGREEEIRDIMSRTADGCLVYGGRQLGKSALLNQIAATHHATEENRIVVRREVKPLGNSEETSEIWTHLKAMLLPHEVVRQGSRTADEISRDIRSWLATRPNGQVVCMFDETDHFMAADTRDDYPQLSRLKELMEDTGRAFKVVFAGLHNVKRMHRQPNSPLAHLGRAICIGPLNRTEDDKRAAHDLVIAPMRAAGFRFESMEAVEEILSWANYYPSLVQEYARGLLSTLNGAGSGKGYRLPAGEPLWTIPTEDLFSHRGFRQIETRIREKFHLTLDLDPRYALVAYTLAALNAEGYEHQALVSGFRAGELLEHASAFWPRTAERPSQAAFDALLDELFDLGVLGRMPIPDTQRFTYCLRTRQVAAMLGSREDIDHALLEIEEKDPTVTYDRTIHRRRYAAAGRAISVGDMTLPYSPLTDFQIERLLGPDGPPARIVCGLNVLGLSKVGDALVRIADAGRLPGAGQADVSVISIDHRKDIRPAIDRAGKSGGQRKILIYTPASAEEAVEVLTGVERQPAVLDGRVRPILLLDASIPKMRELATRREDQSEFLAAWGAEMVRVHLSNIEHPEFDTPSMRERILDTTGGIPADTIRLIIALVRAENQDDLFHSWVPSLRIADALGSKRLQEVLVLVETARNPGDYDAMDDMVREATGADLITHGPDLLAAGLITAWNPERKRIRRTALGNLLAGMIENEDLPGT